MTDTERRRPVALIVDDMTDQRALIRRRIEDVCRVIEASSSEQARDIMHGVRVDILFTDSNLPSLDGKELVRRAKTDERFLGAIVFVSASAGRPDVQMEMIDAGADAIVEKPFHGDQIRQIVREVMPVAEERRMADKKRRQERADQKRKERQAKRVRNALSGIHPRLKAKPAAVDFGDEDPSHD